jgi:hypothetical protein
MEAVSLPPQRAWELLAEGGELGRSQEFDDEEAATVNLITSVPTSIERDAEARTVLDLLEEDQVELLRLHYLISEPLSIRELADLRGCSPATVKRHLRATPGLVGDERVRFSSGPHSRSPTVMARPYHPRPVGLPSPKQPPSPPASSIPPPGSGPHCYGNVTIWPSAA